MELIVSLFIFILFIHVDFKILNKNNLYNKKL